MNIDRVDGSARQEPLPLHVQQAIAQTEGKSPDNYPGQRGRDVVVSEVGRPRLIAWVHYGGELLDLSKTLQELAKARLTNAAARLDARAKESLIRLSRRAIAPRPSIRSALLQAMISALRARKIP